MSGKVIYFEAASPAARQFIDKCRPNGTSVLSWPLLTEEERRHAIEEAEFFITASHPITRQTMSASPRLKFIQKTGSGVDNIDLAAAEELGIMVASTPGTNTCSVTEMTMGLILALYRKLAFMDRETKRGRWLMWEHRSSSFEIRGKVHGIVGLGQIGREVARLSKAFGTSQVYFDARRLSPAEESALGVAYLPLPDLLAAADIVSLHIPLLPSTRHLIGRAELERMKPEAVLINVARGHIVDEAALADLLAAGRLAGAALDTWADEPVRADNRLFGFDNVIATPHIAGGTREALERALSLAFDNIAKVAGGALPDHLVPGSPHPAPLKTAS